MSFDAASIITSLIIGGIGFVAFMYGKRQSRVPQMAAGVLLMVYPYFVPDALLMAVIAVAILGAMYGAIRLGW